MSHAARLSVPLLPVRALAACTPFVGFLAGVALFLSATPVGGPLYEPTLFPDRIPLAVAGADPVIAIAAVGIGPHRLYLTGMSTLFLLGAFAAVASRRRGGSLAALVLGGGAAGTLVTVSGCHCGSGSTDVLWQLAV